MTTIRKQVYDLTAQDFDRCAVWEFALDEEDEAGQDEATVRPWHGVEPLNPADGMFVVRATIELADGTRLAGYLTPPVQGDASVASLQPTALTAGGQVAFWYGVMAPTAKRMADTYAVLGRSSIEVFPVRFGSDVGIAGGPVTGVIHGFLHYESLKDKTIVSLK
jgi:hypothetical protein